MSNITTCPSCNQPLRIPDSLVEQQAKCPACGATFLARLDPELPPSETILPREARVDWQDHRAGLIVAMGICSWILSPVPFGQIAWYMGNKDLVKIRAGWMDPEGEKLTKIGRMMGIIATLLFLPLVLLFCGIAGLAAAVAFWR